MTITLEHLFMSQKWMNAVAISNINFTDPNIYSYGPFKVMMITLYQCLWNNVSTSAFADVSYSMVDVEAKCIV